MESLITRINNSLGKNVTIAVSSETIECTLLSVDNNSVVIKGDKGNSIINISKISDITDTNESIVIQGKNVSDFKNAIAMVQKYLLACDSMDDIAVGPIQKISLDKTEFVCPSNNDIQLLESATSTSEKICDLINDFENINVKLVSSIKEQEKYIEITKYSKYESLIKMNNSIGEELVVSITNTKKELSAAVNEIRDIVSGYNSTNITNRKSVLDILKEAIDSANAVYVESMNLIKGFGVFANSSSQLIKKIDADINSSSNAGVKNV